MKRETRGLLVILFGILFFVLVLIVRAMGATGKMSFIAILIAIFLVYEGIQIRKGDKKSLFEPPSAYLSVSSKTNK
ncbi:MAG: hypothetical protein ABIH92_05480 [Nanoarchaeota archaeon]